MEMTILLILVSLLAYQLLECRGHVFCYAHFYCIKDSLGGWHIRHHVGGRKKCTGAHTQREPPRPVPPARFICAYCPENLGSNAAGVPTVYTWLVVPLLPRLRERTVHSR